LHTLRLTFAYDGSEVRLIRSQRVEMIAPPPVTPCPEEGQSGNWFEVRDEKDTLLYHRVLHDPMPTSVEVFSNDPQQSIFRIPEPDPKGQFTLLVPDLPDARQFVFHGTLPDAESDFPPSRPLVRRSFDELRRFESDPPDDDPARPGSDQVRS